MLASPVATPVAAPTATTVAPTVVPSVRPVRNKSLLVTSAGTGINLALGILYAWSLIKGAIETEFGWRGSQLNDPYALCCLAFAFAMIPAGFCQDRFGPRVAATLGGILVGLGFVLTSLTTSYGLWLVGFGLLAGIGIGFGYSSATPPALKWAKPSRTGLVAGIVVAGFGLAPVYLAPTSQWLLRDYGVQRTMLILGVAFAVIVCGLAQLLVNPPAGYVAATRSASAAPPAKCSTVRDILRSPRFYVLWLIYFIGAGAGLMVISSIGGMAKKSMGDAAFVAVAVMAIGNAAGRILAGILSDRIGRRPTLMIVLLVQAALMFAAIPITDSPASAPLLVVLVASLIGCNYGANLSLFPSFAKDLWGLRSFGINYGVLFTAWGLGGLVLPRVQQMLTAQSGGYASSFVTAGAMLVVGGMLTLALGGSTPTPRAGNT